MWQNKCITPGVKGFKRAVLTYLRANGKLRQALVDTFRGLSRGLLAAESGKTKLLPVLFTSVIINSWKQIKEDHVAAFTRGNVPKRVYAGTHTSTSERSNVSPCVSTCLWIFWILGEASSSLVSLECGGLGTLQTVVRLHASGWVPIRTKEIDPIRAWLHSVIR